MGRNKKFNTDNVRYQLGELFIQHGFSGTSLDDIVNHTGLLRGSLYSTFGSKQGMFISALEFSLKGSDEQLKWGLLIVAMLEVTPKSDKVRRLVQTWYLEDSSEKTAEKIGLALIRHSGINTEKVDNNGK